MGEKSDKQRNCCKFGFLSSSDSIVFEGGKVEALGSFEAAVGHIDKYCHRDGYLYPPLQRTYSIDIKTGEKIAEIENTERPARVFPPPLSHQVTFDSPVFQEDLRRGDAGLVAHLLAVLFETRLQFSGWRFDGKVPAKKKSTILLNRGALPDALSAIYTMWSGWDTELQKRFINILYMHGRAKSCEWEWYKFLTQYLVFDAIYKFSLKLKLINSSIGHQKRITHICGKFEIPINSETVESIVAARNELVHEAAIEGRSPGTMVDDTLYLSKWMERLNARLICAIGGYINNFVRSGWSFSGWQVFDRI